MEAAEVAGMVSFKAWVFYFQRKSPQLQMWQVVCTGCKAGLDRTIMSKILVPIQEQTSDYYFTALVLQIFFCAYKIGVSYIHES